MGHLIKGEWKSGDVVTSNQKGEFDREESTFRSFIEEGSEFEPDENRYHLYVSYACPWAHRTLITRKLKGLEKVVSVSVVSPDMLEHSWTFDKNFPNTTGDEINGADYLYQIYKKHDDKVSCKVTVPVLWDKMTNKIVNNESSEIIRILNSSFSKFATKNLDLYPKEYRSEIDQVNDFVYENINNGVYKTGFATNQEAYEISFKNLFNALEELEVRLEGREYLVSNQLTEADIRLITTLVRFDTVYFTHFKCNQKLIRDFKNLGKYTKRLYEMEAIKSTTHLDHIKRHYFYSHEFLNPYRIVPLGPEILL